MNPRSNSSSFTVSFGGLVEHHRVGVERGLQLVAQPGRDPPLAEEVVDRRHPGRLQHPPHVPERLGREQVALQPQVAVPRLQHQRVDQREDDQVVLRVRGLAEEVPPVVQVERHPRVVVRPVRVVARPEPSGSPGRSRPRRSGASGAHHCRARDRSLPDPAPMIRTRRNAGHAG